ncbi:MAG: hypothetical protein WBN44_16190 [Woeseiaceae bacterium]
MAAKRRKRIRGIAQPILVREPLIVRLCTAFVDNLTLILRTAFVIASLFLVQELQPRFEKSDEPVAEIQPERITPAASPAAPAELKEPVFSEGVKHALNCTFADYRNENFEACVNGPSRVYGRPVAEEDDTGHIFHAAPVLYASLDNRVNSQ